MTDEKTAKNERRREQLAQIVENLYAGNRGDLARDLKVSSSLISMMLRGEREVTDKFTFNLMREIDGLLHFKATKMYYARTVAIEMGRDLYPGFDLPLIVSNADHNSSVAVASRALKDMEDSGEPADDVPKQ